MNRLLYILFLSVFLLDFLSMRLGLLSRTMTWLPEILTMLTIVIISVRITLGYGKGFPPICSFFLLLLLSNIIIGATINLLSAGTLIAGLRTYLKFIPFFILPFVYRFSSSQISGQLKVLLFLSIIQAPISLYQRLVLSKGHLSGDAVRGTLSTSSQLTVFLSCAIAVLVPFYLAKRISLKSFIVLFSLLFIPMTINETKSTIILFPMAFILPVYFSSSGIRIRQFIPIIILIIFAGTAFVFIYDHFMRPKWGYGIIDFLSMEGRTEGYLFTGAEAGTHHGNVGRLDSYMFAFQTLSNDILNLLFGLGIGNVSESFLPSLSGKYFEIYSSFKPKMTGLTLTLWELGVSGVLIYYFLFFMVFKYSRRLSMHDGFNSTLSNGWSVVSLLMMIGILYKPILNENAIGYLFWYYSGYIISKHFEYNRTKLNCSDPRQYN